MDDHEDDVNHDDDADDNDEFNDDDDDDVNHDDVKILSPSFKRKRIFVFDIFEEHYSVQLVFFYEHYSLQLGARLIESTRFTVVRPCGTGTLLFL